MWSRIRLLLGLLATLLLCASAAVDAGRPARLALYWETEESPVASTVNYLTRSMPLDRAVEIISERAVDSEVVVVVKDLRGESLDFAATASFAHKLIMPFVYPSNEGVAPEKYMELALTEQNDLLRRSNHRFLLAPEVAATLEQHPQWTTNNRADVLHTQVASNEEMEQVLSAVRGKKALVVNFQDGVNVMTPSQHQMARYSRILGASSDTIDGKYYKPEGSEYAIYYANTYLYITPDIFTGLLTGLFMFFVLLIGIRCLGSIQGMSSFYDKTPVVGKEA